MRSTYQNNAIKRHRSGADQYHIDYALNVLAKEGLKGCNEDTIKSSQGNPYDVAESLILMNKNGLLEGPDALKNRYAIQEHHHPNAFWNLAKRLNKVHIKVDQRIFDLMITHAKLLSCNEIVGYFGMRPIEAYEYQYIFANLDTLDVPTLQNIIRNGWSLTKPAKRNQ